MVDVALNKVFAGTNHGSGVEFEGYAQRSVSIGDVISVGGVGGVAFAVAGVGFDRLGYDRELGLDAEEVTA